MKRKIEIEDNLEDKVDGIKQEILYDFISWLEDNTDCEDFDDYYQEQGCDYVHECVDGWVPIYYSDIDGLYYLYGSEFEDAYKDAGIGDGSEDNHKQVAIFMYLEAKGFEFHSKITEAFDSWVSEEPKRDLKDFVKDLKEELLNND